jgi:hypothetical protein
MCDIDMLQADSYDLRIFGVVKEGRFDEFGIPTEWELDLMPHEELPRFMVNEPVMTITENSVYLRGLYSKRLSNKRFAAIHKRAYYGK